jgi:hypothetical protein
VIFGSLNTTELLSRIRQAFSFRGDGRIDIDSLASPNVIVANLAAAPYRRDGVPFSLHTGVAALAGVISEARIAVGPGKLVIDQLVIQNWDAASRIYNIGLAFPAVLQQTVALGLSTELGDMTGPASGPGLPVQTTVAQPAASAITATIGAAIVDINTSLVLPFPQGLTLTSAENLIIGTSAVNQGVQVTFFGRYFFPA